MTKIAFKRRLKQNKLNLKGFSELCEIPYTTIISWNGEDKPIPKWVSSWLDLYEKANKYDEILLNLKDNKN